ncbi:hypothetical protein MAHJHV54_49060 [Mycobacterium avium subsp. hominissuis]
MPVGTAPGVQAGTVPPVPVVPRAATAPSWLPEAPSVADLGWSDAPAPDARAGDVENLVLVAKLRHRIGFGQEVVVMLVAAIRSDFPILKETVNGKPLIWFDNAATSKTSCSSRNCGTGSVLVRKW